MNKLKTALSRLVGVVFAQYEEKGGHVTLGGAPVKADAIASPAGVVPALVWLAAKFYSDFNIPFPVVTYRPESQSQLGYVIDDIETPGSASPFLLMVSDFLSQEVIPDNVVELDLDSLVNGFQAWCVTNVQGGPGSPSHGADVPEVGGQ